MNFLEPENNYRKILRDILTKGTVKTSRAGDTISLFNTVWEAGPDILAAGKFPLMTCRKTYFKGALVELFWILGILQKNNPILNGYGRPIDRNNVAYLKREGCNYWDKWADENGDLGPVYGKQLTEWSYDHAFDTIENELGSFSVFKSKIKNQILDIVEKLRTNPDDRRMVSTMWNPGELDAMALPPCHYGFEVYSRPILGAPRELSLRWIQRSCDMPLGIPYDITMYSLLLLMLCKMTDHTPGNVYGLFGDSHIYTNQIEGVKTMLEQEIFEPPTLEYTGPDYVESLYDFKLEWFNIKNYKFAKDIPLEINV